MNIPKEYIDEIIKKIEDKGLMFVEEIPFSKDRISGRWMLSEIIPYTVKKLLYEDYEIEE